MSLPIPAPTDDARRSLSDVIEALGRGDDPQLSIGEVAEAFGERGFGALILLLALMALFPWPPGGKAIFSVPIMLLSAEMVLQRETVWLPRWVTRASVGRDAYRSTVLNPIRLPERWPGWLGGGWRGPSLISVLRRIERLSGPRLPALTGDVADVVIGVACFLLALMMALPVPFGDMLPGVTLIIFGLAVSQRDGLAVIAGAIGTAACAGYMFLVWATVVEIIQRIVEGLHRLF